MFDGVIKHKSRLEKEKEMMRSPLQVKMAKKENESVGQSFNDIMSSSVKKLPRIELEKRRYIEEQKRLKEEELKKRENKGIIMFLEWGDLSKYVRLLEFVFN